MEPAGVNLFSPHAVCGSARAHRCRYAGQAPRRIFLEEAAAPRYDPVPETRMKSNCIPRSLVVAAVMALSSAAACAASGEPRALSESEMSEVYGRGIAPPALAAFGALSATEQGGAYATASAADVLASVNQLSDDGAQGLDRQLAQQRLQSASAGVQATLKLTETITISGQVLVPLNGLAGLSALPFPLLFVLPALPSLPAINNKH
jgi:hypothetical protein